MILRCFALILGVLISQLLCHSAASEVPSGTSGQSTNGCFAWSATQSIASSDFLYLPTGSSPQANGSNLVSATKGDLIDLKCASILCPAPAVPNCYYDSSICSESEWCMLDNQVMWGPWAMGNGGQTPGADGRAGFQCETAAQAGMEWWFESVCSKNSSWGPWDSVRGRCVQYRNEQESCQAEMVTDGDMGPQYALQADGKPFHRPLRCRPDLVCTGDVGPTPHTCVQRRPPNVCFTGPWWDSTWCKVGGGAGGEYESGLPQEVLEQAAQGLLLQLPQEHMVVTEANFWYSELGNRTRNLIQDIVETLWPEVYRNTTTFPLSIPDPRTTGPAYTAAWNSTAQEAKTTMSQTPRVWSTIHSLVTNTKQTMDHKQVQASQQLAIFLAQSFICPDCRGFWNIDVLQEIGIPPSSNDREDHIKWWWRAHNMVSEHTAPSRGGQPWIYPSYPGAMFEEKIGVPYNNTELLNCQNPFFLPFEDAVRIWKIE